ncbi:MULTISPECIES: hypothetical protein [unclassified Robiginitalea]|uniref:hypothetical protein n=1 Tax=Robiginitalea TaxID=252306 RepID=UPI00234B0E39|nr:MULTISPECIES: hypothetical protein [unclassified Robiginitalea]MDC6353597.1 hypothetical protein [Robiginitalea sp. PM2]MDC6373238.1 hypothetical protein [Robiginitalea sp. SP8]
MVERVRTGWITLAFLLVGCFAYAQQTGDFRSVGTGTWTNPLVWETYNGTSWVAATTYPGATAGTNNVYIQGGNTISLNTSVPNTINALFVGDGLGATDTFAVNGNAVLPTPLIDILSGGFAVWTSNVTLYLPAGAAFRVSGGVLDDGKPCSAAKRLVIGTRMYSTCNGGAGADYSFEELNDQGGSLAVAPSADSPICEGEALNLYANPSGAGSVGATFSWFGTGPLGYIYSGTDENPVITGLGAGTYTYTVTIRDASGYTFSESVEAVVNPGAEIDSQPVSQTAFVGGAAGFMVSATGAASYQWQESTDNGITFTDLNNGPGVIGAQSANLNLSSLTLAQSGRLYRAVISPSNPSCSQVQTQEARLTVQVPEAITNRRITYRVIQ